MLSTLSDGARQGAPRTGGDGMYEGGTTIGSSMLAALGTRTPCLHRFSVESEWPCAGVEYKPGLHAGLSGRYPRPGSTKSDTSQALSIVPVERRRGRRLCAEPLFRARAGVRPGCAGAGAAICRYAHRTPPDPENTLRISRDLRLNREMTPDDRADEPPWSPPGLGAVVSGQPVPCAGRTERAARRGRTGVGAVGAVGVERATRRRRTAHRPEPWGPGRCGV